MMRTMLMLAAAAGLATGAHASGVAVAAKMGTLGPGVEFTGYLAEQVNIRGGGNYMTFTYDDEISDVAYESELRFSSGDVLVDWHPLDNNFRITGGLFLNNNEAELFATPDEPVDIGGRTYTPAQVGELHGRAEFNPVAPYFGIGYGNAVKDDITWSFTFDLGVLLQGSPDVNLTSTGPLAGTPEFQANLEEEEAKIQDDADSFKFYPVVSFGLAYYFW